MPAHAVETAQPDLQFGAVDGLDRSRHDRRELRNSLEQLIEETLAEMIRSEHVEPGLLALIAGADAAIRALDRRPTPSAMREVRR
jgi:hypothetical protein